jgi:hypothetical protein
MNRLHIARKPFRHLHAASSWLAINRALHASCIARSVSIALNTGGVSSRVLNQMQPDLSRRPLHFTLPLVSSRDSAWRTF